MKLKDPFGRISQRHEKHYVALCYSLTEAGIDTVEAAKELKGKLTTRAAIGVVAVMSFSGIVSLLLPEYWPVAIAFGVLNSAWFLQTSARAKIYIQRYIDEELLAPKKEEGVEVVEATEPVLASTEVEVAQIETQKESVIEGDQPNTQNPDANKTPDEKSTS